MTVERDPNTCFLAGCGQPGVRPALDAVEGCREIGPHALAMWEESRICEKDFNAMRIWELETALEDSRREARIAWAALNKARGALVVAQQDLIETQKRLITARD